LKYIIGYNHYGEQNHMINSKTALKRNPWCYQIESWKYTITYLSNNNIKIEFLSKLKKELKKLYQDEHA